MVSFPAICGTHNPVDRFVTRNRNIRVSSTERSHSVHDSGLTIRKEISEEPGLTVGIGSSCIPMFHYLHWQYSCVKGQTYASLTLPLGKFLPLKTHFCTLIMLKPCTVRLWMNKSSSPSLSTTCLPSKVNCIFPSRTVMYSSLFSCQWFGPDTGRDLGRPS